MNILILSAGTRNKIIQYFKKNIGSLGYVVATDMSPLAPAIYEADKHYIVPRITDPTYIDCILDICQKEQITGVLSLIDPELSLLAQNAKKFYDSGAVIIGSDYECCERALDKMQMYKWLTEHGYLCAKSYVNPDLFYQDIELGVIAYPVFVKPVRGSASLSISQVENRKTMELLLENRTDLMIQEYLHGQEIGADMYIDMISGEVVSIFTKKKLAMRAGETDKAVSFKDPSLFQLLKKFAQESGYRGQIDIDLFAINGRYYISEVNPRFGGGYPHAYECGCNHIAYILNNLQGKSNQPNIGSYKEEIYMAKYSEVLIYEKDSCYE